MSTRATVWIKNAHTGEERFLYHHCDGYMLDEELDPILKKLTDDQWTVDGVAEAIIEEYEAYGRYVSGVGWDSEYVYKIYVDEKALEKFECGINDTDKGDRKEEKTQRKYLKNTYYYNMELGDGEGDYCDKLLEANAAKEKFEKIERFANHIVEFVNFSAKAVDFDEEDTKTIFDIIYCLSKKKKNGDN